MQRESIPRLNQLAPVLAGLVLILLGETLTSEVSLSLLGTAAIVWALVP